MARKDLQEFCRVTANPASPKQSANAQIDLTHIGEADLVAGTSFRYSGEVCFAEAD